MTFTEPQFACFHFDSFGETGLSGPAARVTRAQEDGRVRERSRTCLQALGSRPCGWSWPRARLGESALDAEDQVLRSLGIRPIRFQLWR